MLWEFFQLFDDEVMLSMKNYIFIYKTADQHPSRRMDSIHINWMEMLIFFSSPIETINVINIHQCRHHDNVEKTFCCLFIMYICIYIFIRMKTWNKRIYYSYRIKWTEKAVVTQKASVHGNISKRHCRNSLSQTKSLFVRSSMCSMIMV
jgi:hypothetical protein